MFKLKIGHFGMFVLLLLVFSCQSNGQNVSKINGLSFVASSNKLEGAEINHLKKIHANYVAIMPFGFIKSLQSSELFFDNPRQWWGERSEGVAETIKMCQEQSIKIMLKPQIWVGDGGFTGLINMESDEKWLEFEKHYSQFILKFAKLAEQNKVEIFCIGTELGRFVQQRPQYWNGLIIEVKKVFSGKITYAENWDCFEKPNFLKDLDFIGVDAYFPINDKKEPSYDEIKKGWQPHVKKMEECFAKTGKQILFTECGYRSVDFAASKPWEFDHKNEGVNEQLQNRLTEVMFELWNEEWMAGGFIWKWFPFHESAGGPTDTQFTPQNKMVEKTIAEFFRNQ